MNYQKELTELGAIICKLKDLQRVLITANTQENKLSKLSPAYGPKYDKAVKANAYNALVVKRKRPAVLKSALLQLKQYNEKHYGAG